MTEIAPCIPKPELVVGHCYKVRARNFDVGVWNGFGFVGPREKFGEWYPFAEYHWDDGPPHGTVWPEADLGLCPVEDLAEGRVVNHPGGTVFVSNRLLLMWLIDKDEEIRGPQEGV